jgi:hypothetical protein
MVPINKSKKNEKKITKNAEKKKKKSKIKMRVLSAEYISANQPYYDEHSKRMLVHPGCYQEALGCAACGKTLFPSMISKHYVKSPVTGIRPCRMWGSILQQLNQENSGESSDSDEIIVVSAPTGKRRKTVSTNDRSAYYVGI